jgi:membrane protein DedA with SNARE-associated domain
MTDEQGTAVAQEPPRGDRPPIDLVAALKQATWVDAICLGGILLSIVLGYVTLPLATVLIRHVVTHLLVTGSITALLTGGALVFSGHLNVLAALAAGICGICKFDPFFFWAGRRYGEHVGHFLETWGGVRPRTVARMERWVARFGLPLLTASYFLPIPTWIVMLLLGASGVRWRWFVLFDVAGAALWCGTFLALGHHFHTQVNHISHLVTHYSRISTIVLIAVVVVFSMIRGSRQQRARQAG